MTLPPDHSKTNLVVSGLTRLVYDERTKSFRTAIEVITDRWNGLVGEEKPKKVQTAQMKHVASQAATLRNTTKSVLRANHAQLRKESGTIRQREAADNQEYISSDDDSSVQEVHPDREPAKKSSKKNADNDDDE